jgi:type 2 lantibiotic biosynthesis protein LanM
LYELLLHHRHELLAADGPLARFQHDEVRVILRATQIYSRLLSESFHPDVLRDALERDLLFDGLWIDVPRRPYLARVVQAECEDLRNGDVPRFTTRPVSRHAYTSSGDELTDFFPESGYALARRRIEQLSAKDMANQVWFLRASVAALDHRRIRTAADPPVRTDKRPVVNRGRYLAIARAVGNRLETLAISRDSKASWVGLTLTNRQSWSIRPLGSELYDGICGVVFFLAYLGAVTEEDRYTALAGAGLSTVLRRIRQSVGIDMTIGGFSGYGGILYTLTHLATLWNRPDLHDQANRIVERLPSLIDCDDQENDIDIQIGRSQRCGSTATKRVMRCST